MGKPVIILVRPQLVENIGTAARAMMNCAMSELRLVAPRDPWPLPDVLRERMAAASSGAEAILRDARIYDSTAAAVADLNGVYATTGRPRDMIKEVLDPAAAMRETRTRLAQGESIGFLFGPERTGLINEDLQCAEKIITIPANPAFCSFNIAQSVLLIAHYWFTCENTAPERTMDYGKTMPATREELFNLFTRLEDELELCGFFNNPAMKPAMVQNMRNALLRGGLTEQEVRTFHGVLTALADGPKRKAKAG